MQCVTRLQVLRGTTIQRLAMTPLVAELVFDTDLAMMFVGDGITVGGIPFSGEQTEVTVIYTADASLSGVDNAIANSATPIDFTLPDATNYNKSININNAGSGLLNVLTFGGQLIYGPLSGPADNLQLNQTNSIELKPKSGAWYLW